MSKSQTIYPTFMKHAVYQPSQYMDYLAPKLPPSRLELEFVYGGSMKGCKSYPLFVSKTGKLVYPSAACGIVYDPIKHTQNVFRKHNDDVKCMALHPNGDLVATGESEDSDDVIQVWKSSTQESVAVLNTYQWFEQGGVHALAFSADGSMLACVGGNPLNSQLVVLDWEKGSVIAKRPCANRRTFDLKFNPVDNTLIWAGKKDIKFFNIVNGNIHERGVEYNDIGTAQSFYNISFDLTNGNTLLGTHDGSIYVCKKNRVIGAFPAHKNAIVSTYQLADGFVTGGKDNKVKVFKFDDRSNVGFVQKAEYDLGYQVGAVAANATGSLIFTRGHHNADLAVIETYSGEVSLLYSGHFGNSKATELWGVSVIPHTNIFVTAGDDGRIILWNSKTHETVGSVFYENVRFRSVAASPDGTFVVAATNTGNLFVYHAEDFKTKSAQPIHQFSAGNEEIRVLKFSSSGSLLAVGSRNSKIYLYDAKAGFKKVSTLEGHNGSVSAIDWSLDDRNLQSTSTEQDLMFWSVETGEAVKQATSMRDTQWATQTCQFGWTVRGIWNGYESGRDINSVSVHFDSNLIACVDESGDVNIFRYPTLQNNPPKTNYVGHCGHTTNCIFSTDGQYLFTTGGRDLSVFQWRVIRKPTVDPSPPLAMTREERRQQLSEFIQEANEPKEPRKKFTGKAHPLYQTSSSNYGCKPQNEVTKHTVWKGINGNFTKGFTGGRMYKNYSLNTGGGI